MHIYMDYLGGTRSAYQNAGVTEASELISALRSSSARNRLGEVREVTVIGTGKIWVEMATKMVSTQ